MTTSLLAKLDRSRLTVGVAVQTCSFDRLNTLEAALQMISLASYVPAQTAIVVDGNPPLLDHLRAIKPPLADIVTASLGPGVSRARNTAAQLLETDIIVYLDDDAIPDVDWLSSMVSTLCKQGVVGVGGKVLPLFESDKYYLPAELYWVVGCTYKGHPAREGPITRPLGTTMAFRRRELLAVGGFNPSFGPRHGRKASSNEELALAIEIRARYGEGRIWYQPDAVVHHKVPPSRCTLPYLLRRSWVEGVSKAEVTLAMPLQTLKYDTQYLWGTAVPSVGFYAVHRDFHSSVRVASAIITTSIGFMFGWLKAKVISQRSKQFYRHETTDFPVISHNLGDEQ